MKSRTLFSKIMLACMMLSLLSPIAAICDEPAAKPAEAKVEAADKAVKAAVADGAAAVAKAAEEVKKATEEVKKEGEEAKAEEAKPAEEEKAEAPKSKFAGKFWALIPPLIAIALALITKEVFSSLFIGLVCGGLLVSEFSVLGTIDTVINKGLISAVSDTAGIFIFLVILGILVALINRTGASAAFGRWAKANIKSRAGAQVATFILGVLIFIDDYFNCLTVGSVMLPVTDSHRVSRAKLAYLIDATAAPICMIAPISSWAAAVAGYAEGTPYTGLELFCRAIPYNFYSLLTFVFILGIIFLKVDFGPMARHERNAIEKGDLFSEGGEVDTGDRPFENAKGKLGDLLIPIILLIAICVFALVYNGGILDDKGFIVAFSDTDATVGLPWGGLLALLLTILYLIARRVISAREAANCIPKGFCAMVPAILILTFATALKNMTSALEAKEYIAGLMEGSAASLNMLLPAVIFVVACVLAFATGTSWGTFGILIPIVVNIFQTGDSLLFIGMSACLAGAVCGDHCSPISDTTIMSSAGARCEHINHVSTQLPYAIAVAAVSFVSFILAGYIQNWYITFPIAVVLTIGMLIVIKVLVAKKQA